MVWYNILEMLAKQDSKALIAFLYDPSKRKEYATMEQWEYRTLKFFTKGFFTGGKLDVEEFDNELNAMGSNGWELVSCFDTSQHQGSSKEVICVFKRKK